MVLGLLVLEESSWMSEWIWTLLSFILPVLLVQAHSYVLRLRRRLARQQRRQQQGTVGGKFFQRDDDNDTFEYDDEPVEHGRLYSRWMKTWGPVVAATIVVAYKLVAWVCVLAWSTTVRAIRQNKKETTTPDARRVVSFSEHSDGNVQTTRYYYNPTAVPQEHVEPIMKTPPLLQRKTTNKDNRRKISSRIATPPPKKKQSAKQTMNGPSFDKENVAMTTVNASPKQTFKLAGAYPQPPSMCVVKPLLQERISVTPLAVRYRMKRPLVDTTNHRPADEERRKRVAWTRPTRTHRNNRFVSPEKRKQREEAIWKDFNTKRLKPTTPPKENDVLQLALVPVETPKATNNPAFSFGANDTKSPVPDNKTAGNPPPAGFVFASPTPNAVEAKANGSKNAPPANPGFQFGKPTSNGSSTPAPVAGVSFGASQPPVTPLDGNNGFSLGKENNSGTTNGGSGTNQAPKPGFSFGATQKQAPAPAANNDSGFSFGSAPATTQPNQPPAKPSLTFGNKAQQQAPAPSGTGFGAAPATNGAPATNQVSFGSTTQPNQPSAKPGFAFGSTQQQAPAPPSTGFGAPPSSNGAPASNHFSFGSKPATTQPNQPSTKPGFTFGNTQQQAPAPTSTGFGAAPATNQFSFGSTPAPAHAAGNGGFGFGAQASAPQTTFANNTNGKQNGSTNPFTFGGGAPAPAPTNGSTFGAAPPAAASQFGGVSAPKFGATPNSNGMNGANPGFVFGAPMAAPSFGAPLPAAQPNTSSGASARRRAARASRRRGMA